MYEDSIEQKYGIVYVGSQHYYIEDLSKRDYVLENCTPYYFKINNDEFIESTWVQLLQKVADYLIEEYPKSVEELKAFSFEWGKQKLFLEEPKISSHLPLKNGLFINCNHTALHSCWTLQDILNFFEIDIKNCKLLIKRNPRAEAKEVKDYYKNMRKEEFKRFVMKDLKKDIEFFEKCINGIDLFDPFFKKCFPTFESLYLFDNSSYFYNYYKEFIDYLINIGIELKKIESLKKRLNYYYQFMKKEYR